MRNCGKNMKVIEKINGYNRNTVFCMICMNRKGGENDVFNSIKIN
jgi:hypothetical protein